MDSTIKVSKVQVRTRQQQKALVTSSAIAAFSLLLFDIKSTENSQKRGDHSLHGVISMGDFLGVVFLKMPFGLRVTRLTSEMK